MKILFLTIFVCFFSFFGKASSPKIKANCTFNDKKLYGGVQFVNSFPDVKIQVVDSFADLKVMAVSYLPTKCGEWRFVNSLPDLKVQIVNSFPDIKIQYVNSFPGM